MSPMRSGRNTHGRGRARLAERACTPGAAGADGGGPAGPPPNGGNGVIRGTTRRRHTSNQILMLQNPTAASLVHHVAYKTWAQGRLALQRGDVETTNTTARPQQGTAETGITSAPENCTKNTHFAPAKAMTVSDNRPSWPTGPGCGARGRRRGRPGFDPTHQATRQRTRSHWCGGRRRVRRARAGFEIDHSERSSRVAISRAAGPDGARNTSGATSNTINDSGRRPRAHQAARPNKPPGGAWNTSGTISNNTRRRQLAGGRDLRRLEHQRCKTQPRQNKTARPHKGRAAESVSEPHRRTTMMSGSPRPLSWRTLEIPSLAATSFAVPSMRGSS